MNKFKEHAIDAPIRRSLMRPWVPDFGQATRQPQQRQYMKPTLLSLAKARHQNENIKQTPNKGLLRVDFVGFRDHAQLSNDFMAGMKQC